MSRPNLARLEPPAYQVLAVSDPAKVAIRTGEVLGELDLDHLCRLLIRSERSLSLVNRRSFAAALADVPATSSKALRPAPPFHEAVAVAREDGKLLERTRRYLAQNPRALEELTPELTIALLRHFDPTMRMRPTSFVRHVVAVGGVTIIAITAAVLGVIHTQQNEAAMLALVKPPTSARVDLPPIKQPAAVDPSTLRREASTQTATVTASVPAPLTTTAPTVEPTAAAKRQTESTRVSGSTAGTSVGALFVPTVAGSSAAKTQNAVVAPTQAPANTAAATASTRPVVTNSVASAAPAVSTPPASTSQASTAGTASSGVSDASANATAYVLRTIVSQNPNAKVEWIKAAKASDNVMTVTSQLRNGESVSQETYKLWNSNGQVTVINHSSATP